MKLRQRIIRLISRWAPAGRAVHDKRYRTFLTAAESLVLDLAYALYHGFIGISDHSSWFLSLCGYYTILAMAKFAAVQCERREGSAPSLDTEYFVMGVCGGLLFLLGIALAVMNTIHLTKTTAVQHGEILMITIAAFTFFKITRGVINALRQRKNPSPLLATVRRIGYAEVAASVLTMQHSMLISFGDMSPGDIRLMNALTGAGIFLFVTLLGSLMIKKGIKERRGKKHGNI